MKGNILMVAVVTAVVGALALSLAFYQSLPTVPGAGEEVELTPVSADETGASRSEGTRRRMAPILATVAEVPVEQAISGADWETISHSSLIEKLFVDAAETEPEALRRILLHLEHEAPEVRRAAVEAAIQFGSRDAIPVLRQAADRASDLREKVFLMEAAEFLELPTRTELRQQGLLPPRRVRDEDR
jgi:hypothetical protein